MTSLRKTQNSQTVFFVHDARLLPMCITYYRIRTRASEYSVFSSIDSYVVDLTALSVTASNDWQMGNSEMRTKEAVTT